MVFLAHGTLEGIYGIDEVLVRINDIQLYLRSSCCLPFKGKNKVLIFQSCRVASNGKVEEPKAIEEDFLVAFATQRDTPSIRYVENGSPYIKCLIKVIEEQGEREDFLSMLTEVRKLVCENVREHHQVPDCHSLLRSKLYLKK